MRSLLASLQPAGADGCRQADIAQPAWLSGWERGSGMGQAGSVDEAADQALARFLPIT